MNTVKSINPFTEQLNAEVEILTTEQIDKKIQIANDAFKKWKNVSNSEKKELFLKFAEVVESKKNELAELEMNEMGMLYDYSLSGLNNTVILTKWFAENFENILNDTEYETQGMKVKTQYDPMGVLFGIAPWNFPFNQVLRAAIPNILAGNTVVYKHASNTPLAGAKIEELFLEAGFPIGIYQNLQASSRESEYILSKPEIKGVNLTGSERAGVSIGSLAGKYLKPSVLELGGNDAFIVCDTDDLEGVAKEAVAARISNNGQKCNSSKRFIVREEQYDDFCKYFVKYTNELIIGDPKNSETQIGPMAKEDLVKEIDSQVKKTIEEGATLLAGGNIIDRKGFFYEPTVLGDVTKNMTSYKEEVFGPVASIIKVTDLDEAIKVANDSDFGLCGCVYGNNEKQVRNIASQIETGMVFINKQAGSKASLPFGGVKKSGYGKENGPEGLKAFTNKKVIVY